MFQTPKHQRVDIGEAIKVAQDGRSMPWVGTPQKRLRYSVVPGGIHSVEQLHTVYDSDPEYHVLVGEIDWSKMRSVQLTAPNCFFSSFRKPGNSITWTVGPSLCLPAGEQVFSDGQIMIRAACGNRIDIARHLPIDPSIVGEELSLVESLPAPRPEPTLLALAPPLETLTAIPTTPTSAPFTVTTGSCCTTIRTPPPSGPTVSVPEPSTLVLLLIGIIVVLLWIKTGKGRR